MLTENDYLEEIEDVACGLTDPEAARRLLQAVRGLRRMKTHEKESSSAGPVYVSE